MAASSIALSSLDLLTMDLLRLLAFDLIIISQRSHRT